MDVAEDDAYQRGHLAGEAAGQIAARLDDHDKHFASINGQLAKIGEEIHAMVLGVQRLGDQAVARDATVLTTAAALKDAEEARRDKSELAWSPVAKALTAISGVVAVLLLLLAWLQFTR